MPALILYAAAYVLGIAAGEYLGVEIGHAAVLLGFALVLNLFALKVNARQFLLPTIAFLFLIIGMFFTVVHGEQLQNSILAKAAAGYSTVVVNGSLAGDATYKDGILGFDLNVYQIEIRDEGKPVVWRVSECVRVRVKAESPVEFLAGERVRVDGRLSKPKSTGEFDYERYLYHKNIMAILMASAPDIAKIKSTEFSLVESTSEMRRWIKNVYTKNLPPDSAALLIGIVLGDDSGVTDKLGEEFRATGLTHILAASGMNIALVLAALWPLLRMMRVKPVFQFVALISFAGLYTMVSGMQPSLTRAFLMAAVALTAWITGRDNNGLASISSAALLLLVLNPFTLYDIGFQLSFLATFSLLLFVPIIDSMMTDLPGWIRAGLSVTIAAQIGVLPVLVYYFGQVSMISVLANLLIIPLAEPALVVGLILLPFEALIPILAKPFYWFLAGEMGSVI
ncbi:MAG: ComEC/Rec2 family competence protein, partial [Rubrobacteridae bacterium]|nr:ComEC/Rec2 family competence protein [Rubrobacteridae bacterium]